MPGAPDPSVLELRIHGVKNTLPGAMLGVKEAEVHQIEGDENGGFWVADHDTPDRPADVRREAYSWGLLARTGGTALPLVGQLAVHLGWLFILPFGLCNVAYWTRGMRAQRIPNGWVPGRGAALVRLFALGLTLLYVCALAAVALDLIGVQCYTDDGVCAQLPALFDGLAGLDRGLRLGILSLVPLAGMLLLYVLAHRGRVRYEASVTSMADRLAAGESESAPTLATPGFWSKARIGSTTERLHFAAVLLLLAVLLAWDRVYWTLPGCGEARRFLSSDCLSPATLARSAPASAALGALAVVGLLLVIALVVAVAETPESDDVVRSRRRFAGILLAASVLLYVGTAVVGALPTAGGSSATGGASSFLGLVSTPSALLIGLLVIALSGLGWRRGVPPWLSFLLLVPAIAALAVPYVIPQRSAALNVLWASLAGALVVAQLVLVVAMGRRNRDAHARTAWSGAGPGVVLLLALGATMLLTSLLVVGVARWLESPPTAPVFGMWRVPQQAPFVLHTPDAYVEFGLILLAMLVAEGLVLLTVVAVRLTRLPVLTSAAPRDGGREVSPLPAYPGGQPPVADSEDRLVVRVLRSRRFAALAHRGEPALAVVATAIALGVAATLIIDMQPGSGTWAQAIRTSQPAQTLAIAVLGGSALAIVAAVAANALTNKERPVGMLWDLICFLPRAGHPFGPPSYSERVVPELSDRIERWLGDPEVPDRKVILSAHSLGTVLAIATLFARYAVVERPLTDIGLLTYGSQPRAYFGRFFPDLFGPQVLGTRSSVRPTLFGADPWLRQILLDAKPRQEAFADRTLSPTLCDLLDHPTGPAWINLWRRTDFLGFPVDSFANDDGNLVDRGASELEPGPYEKVATHSNYPATTQYAAAFAELHRRLLS